jgi:hypothetical protein
MFCYNVGIGFLLIDATKINNILHITNVTTLTLSSRPMQGHEKMWAESYIHIPRVWESVRECAHTLSSELPL